MKKKIRENVGEKLTIYYSTTFCEKIKDTKQHDSERKRKGVGSDVYLKQRCLWCDGKADMELEFLYVGFGVSILSHLHDCTQGFLEPFLP